jgi:predicted DNA-binding transcriptional regulator AlpA
MASKSAAETRKEGAGEDILLIEIKGLARMLGRSERALWRDQSAGRLPRPIALGGMTKWRMTEIREWVAAGVPRPGRVGGVAEAEPTGGIAPSEYTPGRLYNAS